MGPKAKLFGVSIAIMAVAAIIVLSFKVDSGINPLEDSQVELKNSIDGTIYILTRDGRLFREDARSRKWHYQDTVYQPEEMTRAFVVEHETTYRFDAESGKKITVRREFAESFEDLNVGVDGHVKISQDDQLVVDTNGVTLPLRSAIYSSLEVDITAHSLRVSLEFSMPWVSHAGGYFTEPPPCRSCFSQTGQISFPDGTSLPPPLPFFWFRSRVPASSFQTIITGIGVDRGRLHYPPRKTAL